jgi:hypothetical protein
MPTPRPFPMFIPVGGTRVQVPLSTGQTVEVDLNELQSPLDIVPDVEHPDFEAAFAALRWFRLRGVSADQAFADPNLIGAYLSATYTPMEVL